MLPCISEVSLTFVSSNLSAGGIETPDSHNASIMPGAFLHDMYSEIPKALSRQDRSSQLQQSSVSIDERVDYCRYDNVVLL